MNMVHKMKIRKYITIITYKIMQIHNVHFKYGIDDLMLCTILLIQLIE